MSKALAALSLVLIVLCGGPAAGQEPRTRLFEFETSAEKTVPDGFVTGMTGRGKTTEWAVRAVDGNRVLAHIGFWDEDPDGVFPVCWVKQSSARDLTLSVRLFPVRPPADIPQAHHDGAGIVVRFKNPDNYYLLRAVPHETRVRLYKVVKGRRSTLAGRNLDVALGTWHGLTLRARANVFTASFNGKELFRHRDDTFTDAGAFGLWSKPSNVTYFDDLKAVIVD
ncbi:MAG: hypothetical protein OEU46_15035 [Alphaproteobacteria bacterium]|nr:hypothetical protein [Alphaproteobacteria bacterium]